MYRCVSAYDMKDMNLSRKNKSICVTYLTRKYVHCKLLLFNQ